MALLFRRRWHWFFLGILLLCPRVRAQCAAPVVDGQSLSGSCAEGATIQDFGICTPQCADGYILSVPDISGVLFCFGGNFQPSTFTCIGLNCTPPVNIAHGAEQEGIPNCQENWTEVPHGDVCTPRCAEGFTPDVSDLPWDPVLRKVYLPCVAGVLAPNSFTCLGSPCPIPASGNRPGEIPFANVERPCSLKLNLPEPIIPHQGFCDPLCLDGYHPNVSLIPCFAGKLATLWECLGDPCPAPSLIQYAAPVTCKEGPLIQHDGTCTPNCAEGYESTESGGLSCLTGLLIPPRFECLAVNCTALHWIPGALLPLPGYNKTVAYEGNANDPVIVWVPPESRTCQEGPSISSGTTCTANCQPGYVPDISLLQCQTGSLTPPTYRCMGQPCMAPSNVPDAPSVPCVEGALIAHGSDCTLMCDLGFVPSLSNLSCNATLFEPSTFSCIGQPCSYPTGIPFAASPACLEALENLTHGAVCTTQCLEGYIPSEAYLYCYGSLMRPSSFQCIPNTTYANYETPGSRIAKAWSKNMATAALSDGFVLACHKDDFSQSMHCVSMLSGATLLRQGDRSSVTAPDVEMFVMQPLSANKVMACYKLEMSSTSCRTLEVSTESSSLVQSSEAHLSTGDTYHLSLARLSDEKGLVCFQSGLSQWICRVVRSGGMALGTELVLVGTLADLTVTVVTVERAVVCAARAERQTECHLLSVSSTDDLSILSSSWVSSGATFLTAEVVAESSLVVLCFSHWAGTSEAICKVLQTTGDSLQEISNVTVDHGISRYLTLAPVRADRLLLCFERQGPVENLPCLDHRLQCEAWANDGECAFNPKYMEEFCQRSCGICTDVGPSRGQCNVLGLQSTALHSGPPVVVNRGITWNLATSKVDNETALVCFSDATVRDAGRCCSVWAPQHWEILEARACDAADGTSEVVATCLA